MGKVSPKENSRSCKQRRQLRSSRNKFLKPGTLAQLRHNLSTASTRFCTDTGKKRLAMAHSRKTRNSVGPEDKAFDKSPLMISPVDFIKQNSVLGTPKTPRTEDCKSESRLESLPMDLLVCLFGLCASFWLNSLILFIIIAGLYCATMPCF